MILKLLNKIHKSYYNEQIKMLNKKISKKHLYILVSKLFFTVGLNIF